MVVFVDLESDDDDAPPSLHNRLASLRFNEQYRQMIQDGDRVAQSLEDSNANCASEQPGNRDVFAAALTCYPVALSIASHLDLNDLHALSMTCRSINANLNQYTAQLLATSLRCAFDSLPLLSDLLHTPLPASESDCGSSNSSPSNSTSTASPRYALSTKICACALDLVAECRRCGIIVCRNCTAKAPSDRYLKERHRRLCRKCHGAPLMAHLQPVRKTDDTPLQDPPVSSASSSRSARSPSDSKTTSDDPDPFHADPVAFTSKAFLRGPCLCASRGVYLCAGCGHNLRSNDTTYGRVWTWRSRYSTHMGGGIGTGLGLGNQGQKCGRGDQCLESGPESISWVEIDCSEGAEEHEALSLSRAGTPVGDTPSPGGMSNRPGYFQQEIEGIGGVVKKKVRKRVKVGATVYEYDDERKTGKYLEREASGKERSWCGWCGRVCLGEKDRQGQREEEKEHLVPQIELGL